MKALVAFNIKNAKYAIPSGTAYGTPVSIGYSDSMSLEANYSEKLIYGDGRVVYTIPNDKGKTGSLGLLAIDDDYEIAMKRRMRTANGTAEIKQLSSVEHALYFEFEYLDKEDGAMKTAKSILYGVTSGRPSQSYRQTTDDINTDPVSHSLTIKGIPLLNASGDGEYKDQNGNTVYVWQETSIPGDSGYETFGNTITQPKAPGAAPDPEPTSEPEL